jgi:hypothetical protein
MLADSKTAHDQARWSRIVGYTKSVRSNVRYRIASLTAPAFSFEIAKVAAQARIHRSDEHEFGWKCHAAGKRGKP